eukprot:scaffold4991_cov417-Prasinococcus_capsulatus_cf.AAC.13
MFIDYNGVRSNLSTLLEAHADYYEPRLAHTHSRGTRSAKPIQAQSGINVDAIMDGMDIYATTPGLADDHGGAHSGSLPSLFVPRRNAVRTSLEARSDRTDDRDPRLAFLAAGPFRLVHVP